jgi:light-regulated signal transduction histidine kinase (bacteriophytochrome)
MDRIRLYDAILAKSSEIETKNRELDDFAYVVSHDLKEPLITIEGYAKILEADYSGRLDTEGLQFLGSIRAAGVRMKSMIEDLLTLARVGRATESDESLPLGDVIRDVLQDLEFSIREKKATVTVQGDLPSVTFDRAQLGIVFRNLVSNALKFNTSPDPRVEISARIDPGEVVLAVSDNGIGIEPAEHERIFRIFQRVHPRETFDGTGAGLAIVRNIVEHRGGRIWLESTVGEGSTFFFSIPRS